MTNATARYALRMETADGTIEAAYHHMSRKADAIAAARQAAKNTVCADVIRIWVDDTKTDIGIKSFDVKREPIKASYEDESWYTDPNSTASYHHY